VIPGLTSAAVMSSTSRANLQTVRIASWPLASRISIFDLFKRRSALGTPSSAQSGRFMDSGTVRMGESGYTGRMGPVKECVGNGLKVPATGSFQRQVLE
jgi:hypothetical protein